MRYLVILGLSLLVWGCEEEQPVYHPKPRTTDLIAVGVEETANGEVWVLTQEVDRWQEADPIHLDSEGPYDPQYKFETRTVKLQAGGRWFQSVGGSDDEYGLSYYYRKVPDGYLIAGVNLGYCGGYYNASVPTISVRDENNQLVRFAQLSCDYSYAFYQDWDEMHIWPKNVVALANGNLLYWGLSANGGGMQAICMTQYGEALWSGNQESASHATTIASMRHGGYARVDLDAETVRTFHDDGVFDRSMSLGTTDTLFAQTITQLENANYIVAGVDAASNDPHLWTYSPSAEAMNDTTIAIDGCQDSIAIFSIGDNILLLCRNGESCSGPGSQTAVLLDEELNIIGETSFGGNTHVVLKDVTVGADGSIFLCGAYDRGNGSYSALVTKYDASLNAVWSTTVQPSQ